MSFSTYVETMGADVELFLRGKDGKIKSAVGLIGGTKHSPRIVPNGNLQEDNALAEFAIDPAHTEDEFVSNISSVVDSLKDALPAHTLEVDSAKYFYKSQVDSPQAQEFGCDPDWDAWSMMPRPTPDPLNMVARNNMHLRSAGGHIHLGIPFIKEHDVHAKCILVRALDYFVGKPIREADPKTSLRDNVYGGFGSVRFKPYGLEYRTPPSIWIKDEESVRWIVRNCVNAVEFMFTKGDGFKMSRMDKQHLFDDIVDGIKDGTLGRRSYEKFPSRKRKAA